MSKTRIFQIIKDSFQKKIEKRIEKESVEVKKLMGLSIETDISDVEIFVHKESRIEVILETYEEGPELYVNTQDEHLMIEAKLEKSIIFTGFLNSITSCTLKIVLPKDIASDIQIITKSGDIDVDGLILSKLNIKSGSGDLHISNITSNHLQSESSSGDQYIHFIHAENIVLKNASGDINGKNLYGNIHSFSASGDIELFECYSDMVEISSSSGDIEINQCQTNELKTKSSSGDIRGEKIRTVNGEASNSSGDIQFQSFSGNLSAHTGAGDVMVEMIHESNIFINSGSGDINAYLCYENIDAKLDIQTSLGVIETNLDKHFGQMDGKYTIQLKSGTGDISFIQK